MTRIIKRLIDLITASFVLILLAPVMALVAMASRIILGRPVFFRQIGPGYRTKPFTLYVDQHVVFGQGLGAVDRSGVVGLTTAPCPRRNAARTRTGTSFTLSYVGMWKHNRL